ncbi:MAG: hypothetical protein V4484_08205 [Pseudomonadota bacterium]
MSFRLNTDAGVVRRRYRAFGLVIDSTLAIPGALAVTGAAALQATADVEIRIGALAADMTIEKQAGPYSYSRGSIIFDMPKVARYCCERGLTITVEPAVGADQDAIEGMLIATALPVLLWMRNRVVLHGACVQLARSPAGFAIAGPSGSGKSTLLQQFYQRGASVVGDDTICLGLAHAAVSASGLPGLIHGPVTGSARRPAIAVATDKALDGCRLNAVFVLRRAPAPADPVLSELTGVAALEAMLGQRHRAGVLHLLGKQAAVLQALAGMLAGPALRVFAWHRTEGDVGLRDKEVEFIEDILQARTI